MSRDRYDLNRLTERLFEDVNIIADKATSTNSLELILDLVEQSLDTDPKYRESVRKQAGVTDGMSYMRLVPQDNPQGMLPPTPWGRKAAEEAYRQHQVRQLDPRLRLLRTLATGSCKDHDTPETNDYLALMDFNVGDHVTMGPGLSTTVTTPHWLGGGGILLIIEGASHGVPLVGSRGDVSNESEVFLPDLLHCTVLEETTDGTYLGKRFERIYRLGIDSEETPVPKRELRPALVKTSCQIQLFCEAIAKWASHLHETFLEPNASSIWHQMPYLRTPMPIVAHHWLLSQ
ncbi:hypothetical protein [Bifidobacterium adolescentis]|uniref:hypothetical protein n=1 Tax=Bifidobacterium adolescentis TaxID=1680 RepID=UPI004062A22C